MCRFERLASLLRGSGRVHSNRANGYAILVLAIFLAVAASASAELAVVHVEGVTSKRLQRDIEKALPEGVDAKPSAAADAAFRRALKKNPLPDSSDDFSNDGPFVKSVRRALESSKRDLAVVVVVGRPGRKTRDVRVAVVPASDDRRAFFRSTTLPTFHSADEHVAWWAKLFEEATAKPPEPAEAPEPEPEQPAPAPSPPPRIEKPPPPPKEPAEDADYFFVLAGDVTLRQFTDSESGTGPPRSYRAFPVPGFRLSAELYPLADGHIGIEGDYGMSLGVHSKTSDGSSVATQFLRAQGALVARVFTAHRGRSPWLALLFGYGYSRFVFDGGPPNREIPTAVYQMLRAGIQGRAPIDRVTLSLGAEYDRILSIDALGNVAPAPPGNGVTTRAGAGFEVVPGVFARLDLLYTWLLFALRRDIPSTVVDQYLTVSVGAELDF